MQSNTMQYNVMLCDERHAGASQHMRTFRQAMTIHYNAITCDVTHCTAVQPNTMQHKTRHCASQLDTELHNTARQCKTCNAMPSNTTTRHGHTWPGKTPPGMERHDHPIQYNQHALHYNAISAIHHTYMPAHTAYHACRHV